MAREFIRVRARGGAPPEVAPWPTAEKLGRRPMPAHRPKMSRQNPSALPLGPIAIAFGALSLLAVAAVLGFGLWRSRPAPASPPPIVVAAAKPAPPVQAPPVLRPAQPAPAPPAPVPPTLVQPKPAAPTSDQAGLRPATQTPAPVAAKPAVAPPPPAAKPLPARAAPQKAASPAGSRAQIGALDSAALADRAYRELKAAMPGALASARLEVEPVVTGNGATLYRAYALFPTEDGARAFCSRMRAAGRACILRPAAGAKP